MIRALIRRWLGIPTHGEARTIAQLGEVTAAIRRELAAPYHKPPRPLPARAANGGEGEN